MGTIGTGKFLTRAEQAEVEVLRNAYLLVRIDQRAGREAAQRLLARIDYLALQHGLAPVQGDMKGDVVHYGVSVRGELTQWDGGA